MAESSGSGERRPPQDLVAEAAVLGAMLLDSRAISEAIEVLGTNPDHFYLQSHRHIYDTILKLDSRSRPVDVLTVTDELRRNKQLEAVGGAPYLSELLDTVVTTAHCAEHARLVLDRSIQRQLIEVATDIVRFAYDDERPSKDLIEEAEQKIFAVHVERTRRGFIEVGSILPAEEQRINEAAEQKRLLTGIETGFHQLDELTSGLQKGDLIIMAGRPSMGKTALVLNIAVNVSARSRIPVAVFSLEMSTEALVQRLLCSEAGVSMTNLRRGMLNRRERERLAQAFGNLGEAQVFIDDSPGLNPHEMRARARRLSAKVPLGLVVIDYIQLMEAAGGHRRDRNRQQEISEISRALKEMAKELNLPVVAISQLSRAPEARPGKRPQLADLRESGAIEQDADVVLLLFRQEHYEPDNDEVRGRAEVNIAKQRHGQTRTIGLTFLGESMRFENPYVREYADEEIEEAVEDDYLGS